MSALGRSVLRDLVSRFVGSGHGHHLLNVCALQTLNSIGEGDHGEVLSNTRIPTALSSRDAFDGVPGLLDTHGTPNPADMDVFRTDAAYLVAVEQAGQRRFGRVQERLCAAQHADVNLPAYAYGGSNPSRPT